MGLIISQSATMTKSPLVLKSLRDCYSFARMASAPKPHSFARHGAYTRFWRDAAFGQVKSDQECRGETSQQRGYHDHTIRAAPVHKRPADARADELSQAAEN